MEQYIRDRITQLRLSRKLSEYQLSYNLGHSKSYINNISSGKTLPSMSEFLLICEYFDITPMEFFDENNNNPILVNDIMREIKNLDSEDLLLIATIIKRIKN